MKNAPFWLILLAIWLFAAGRWFVKNRQAAEKTSLEQSAQLASLTEKLAAQKTDTLHFFAENAGQTARVIERGKQATIYFPTNLLTHLDGQAVDVFFKKTCAKYRAGQQQIHLVGHTDDLGTPDQNLQLGWQRALTVRKILCDCGISENRVLTGSKGETEPATPNSDETARLLNRRVELTITDKKTEK